MAWTTVSTPLTWNVTDSDLLDEAQYALLENGNADASGTFITSMFSETQFINALNQRQWQFMKDTGCVLTRATQPTTPSEGRYTFPTDFITDRRLTWQPLGGDFYSLERSDSYELDIGNPAWQTSDGIPLAYQLSTTPTLEFDLAPSPANVGALSLLYDALSTTLTGSGVKLSIPDEFTIFVKWGALGDLLGQDGEGSDPQRARYCEMRYQQGVELCRLLLRGPRG